MFPEYNHFASTFAVGGYAISIVTGLALGLILARVCGPAMRIVDAHRAARRAKAERRQRQREFAASVGAERVGATARSGARPGAAPPEADAVDKERFLIVCQAIAAAMAQIDNLSSDLVSRFEGLGALIRDDRLQIGEMGDRLISIQSEQSTLGEQIVAMRREQVASSQMAIKTRAALVTLTATLQAAIDAEDRRPESSQEALASPPPASAGSEDEDEAGLVNRYAFVPRG